MPDQSFVSLLGLKCLKQHANTVKKVLINNNWLNFDAKIISKDESVIFPLLDDISLEVLTPDQFSLIDDFVFEIEKFSFIKRSLKVKDVSKKLQTVVPDSLHDFLPRSYDLIGSILLVKLEEEVLPYKEKIAEIYLSNLTIRSVFHKIGEVHSPFRVASWECIGGVNDTVTLHKMNNLEFQVDIEKVYFNPRLNNEYLIVSDQMKDDEIVWDLFCGIGAFTLTLANRKRVTIHANDINPVAITLLEENVLRNKRKLLGNILLYNVDAQELIPQLPPPNRIFMNLPENATDFLPEILLSLSKNLQNVVTIYLYHFTHKEPSDRDDLTKNTELKVLSDKISFLLIDNNLHLKESFTRIVRDVSPSKTHFVTELIIQPKKSFDASLNG
ncbi:MAG: class I SAM-dependent methyltransferase [Candidatus Hodarchaeales archaeon]|jgi:tRNA (guanine37-N1)-methyltransferase